MHIYTMGTKQYATKIAEIIDSDNIFFKEHRIISRDDCTDFSIKNLKRLFPCDDTMVLIVDDREDVWCDTKRQVSPNLIKIEPYHYFDTFEELNLLPQDRISLNHNTPNQQQHINGKDQVIEQKQIESNPIEIPKKKKIMIFIYFQCLLY